MEDTENSGGPYGLETLSSEPGERLTHDVMTAEMSSVYDAKIQEAEAEAKAKPPLPTLHGPKGSVEDTMARTAEWLDMPAAERQQEAEAHRLVKEYKEGVEKFGLNPTEYELLIKRNGQPSPPEWQPFSDRLSRAYPNQRPHEVVNGLYDLLENDPDAFGQWAQQQVELSKQQRGGNDDAAAIVRDFAQSRPDFAELENDIATVINSGQVQVTHDKRASLKAAYDYVKSRRPKYGPGESLRARMAANWPGR